MSDHLPHPAAPANHQMSKICRQRRHILTLDGIRDIKVDHGRPHLHDTVAGYKACLMAANRLPKFMPMVGTAVGMIKLQ